MVRFFVVLLLFISAHLSAQDEFRPNFYVEGSVTIGNFIGYDASANYQFSENYIFTVGNFGALGRPNSEPSDFERGAIEALPLIFISGPFETIYGYNLGVGRIHRFKYNDRARMIFSLGISKLKFATAGDWMFQNSPRRGLSNYTYSYSTNKAWGVILKSRLEILQDRFSRKSISLVIEVNRYTNQYAIAVGSTFGSVRTDSVSSTRHRRK